MCHDIHLYTLVRRLLAYTSAGVDLQTLSNLTQAVSRPAALARRAKHFLTRLVSSFFHTSRVALPVSQTSASRSTPGLSSSERDVVICADSAGGGSFASVDAVAPHHLSFGARSNSQVSTASASVLGLHASSHSALPHKVCARRPRGLRGRR